MKPINILFKAIDTVKPGSDGLVFLPYLYGERAPVWDAKSSGAFININFKHQQQHFLRAALEGICFALERCIERRGKPPTTYRRNCNKRWVYIITYLGAAACRYYRQKVSSAAI
jgi:sugar (pentulose or hexulose) kinase